MTCRIKLRVEVGEVGQFWELTHDLPGVVDNGSFRQAVHTLELQARLQLQRAGVLSDEGRPWFDAESIPDEGV